MKEKQTSKPNATVVGLGACTWDEFIACDDFPQDEGVTLAKERAEFGGGPVATALCVLGHLGTTCCMLDSFGDDADASKISRELLGHQVDTSLCSQNLNSHSSKATILVRRRDGARHIYYTPTQAPDPVIGEVVLKVLEKAQLFHCNGRYEDSMYQCIAHAKKSGTWISFDGGAHRYRPSLNPAIEAANILIVAKQFAEAYSQTPEIERQATLLLRHHPKVLSITDGARGSHHWFDGEYHFQAAYPASRIVDTTGCGDVFHGAMIHGILQNWEPQRISAFAAKWASKNGEGLGGRYVLNLPDWRVTPP